MTTIIIQTSAQSTQLVPVEHHGGRGRRDHSSRPAALNASCPGSAVLCVGGGGHDPGEELLQGAAEVTVEVQGDALRDTYVRDMLKRAGARAGVVKRVHPHGLRHSYASALVREGVPLNVISKALGHSSSAITSRYLDHIAPADVIALGRTRAWTADGQ